MMAVPGAIRILSPYMGGLLIDYFQNTLAVREDIALIRAVKLAWSIAFLTGLLVAYLRLRYLDETISADESERYGLEDAFDVLKESYKSIWESIK